MVDKNVITIRLKLLLGYLKDLDKIALMNDNDYLNDVVSQRYTERTFQLAMEACIDIASHIASYEGYREAEDTKGLFLILEEERILPKDLALAMAKMSQFRNLLVHDYVRIDSAIVISIVKTKLIDLQSYANHIVEKFLQ